MASDYAKIRGDNIRRLGEETDHLALSDELYAARTHFLFELLQNAEDAKATQVAFELFGDRLEMTHDGRPFSADDVVSICNFRRGTKAKNLTQIGKFGIGFKSVYAFTQTPEVHSGDEHFKITHYARPWGTASSNVGPSAATLFVLPFDKPDVDAQTAREEIGAGLTKLSARTLLFLRNIKEITYKLPDQTGGRYLREEIHHGQSRQITVIGPEGQETWLVFERPVKAPDGVQVRVEIAFGLDATAKNPDERIVNVTDSPLVVYFPTDKETRLGFLIQGPYRTTPARDNIRTGDDWNKTLVNETALLVADTLPKLKEMGLLTVSLLEALPIKVDDFREDSMFHPIFAEVREALLNNDLLPTDDGTFVSPPNARLAGAADLRELLGGEQLQSLLQSTTPIKWLSREITKDRTLFLHAYLRGELKVEELDADKFAGKIDTRFLKNQTDEWFKAFYVYLSGHKHLWQPAGPLRDKCILRLEDGSQARPFADDGKTPMVYLPPENATEFPFVKREIASDEGAKNFLKGLGLSEPDICDEVIRKVLPKYDGEGAASISPEEHQVDIQKIFSAIVSGKERVIGAAKNTPFLKAVDQDGSVSFRRPVEVYVDSPDLRLYFGGSSNLWLLFEEERNAPIAGASWEDLGVARLPRPLPSQSVPAAAKEPAKKWKFRVTENYELDGLRSVLQRLQGIPDFDRQQKTVLVLWEFLRNHLASNPQIFKGRCSWYHYKDRDGRFDSQIVECLQEAKWIPTKGGTLEKPGDVPKDDLLDDFAGDHELINILGMGANTVKGKLTGIADNIGIPPAAVELISKNPKEFCRLWQKLAKPEFPTDPLENPARRQQRNAEHLADAPKKDYALRSRTVRISAGAIDKKTWLKEKYTNNSRQMVCQICKYEMPFRVPPGGEYYFEAVEALGDFRKEAVESLSFSKENEAQYLALCPVCAARYKVFVKGSAKAVEKMRDDLKNAEGLEVPIKLGDFEGSIRFVETHLFDIRAILSPPSNVSNNDGEMERERKADQVV